MYVNKSFINNCEAATTDPRHYYPSLGGIVATVSLDRVFKSPRTGGSEQIVKLHVLALHKATFLAVCDTLISYLERICT